MGFEAQDLLTVRECVISPNKQITYGTALADNKLTRRMRFEPGMFAAITRGYRGDSQRAGKGHPFPTERQTVTQDVALQGNNLELTDFLAGWLFMFAMGHVSTSGAGPYVHTFSYELASNIAPVTTLYFEDTADVKYKVPDFSLTEFTLNGAETGAVLASFQGFGSGRVVDGAMGALPSLSTESYFMNNAANIQIGPSGGALTSIKERVRSWALKVASASTLHRSPGGGLYGTMTKLTGVPRATLSLVVAAKDTDDLRTLFINDTAEQIQVDVTTDASHALSFSFANCYVSAAQLQADGNEAVWQIEVNEESAIQSAGQILNAQVTSTQATFGVAA